MTSLKSQQPSAAPFIANIQESEPLLQIHALKNLVKIVDHSWHEIANSLSRIEELAESQTFQERALASFLASKVYYYLENFEKSLSLALDSGDKFDLNERSQYVEKLINVCVDQYTSLKLASLEAQKQGEAISIDPKMESVIDRMFTRCFKDKMFRHVIGIAVECRRLDKVREAIEQSGEEMEDNLGYTYNIAQENVQNKEFRTEILRLLLIIYQNRSGSSKFDPYKIAKCQFFLQIPEGTAALLESLVKSGDDGYLHAYQIAFDICEKENQAYQSKVSESVTAKMQAEENPNLKDRFAQILAILKGEIRDRLCLQFLKKNNHTDVALIANTKKSIGAKSMVLHGATVWSNAMMNAFTTNDSFLQDNMSWVGHATNWNRFNATASLGIIHSGNKGDAMQILQPYFSGIGAGPEQVNSPYSTAGAYFAYGLIHQNQYAEETVNYFMDGYRNSGQNEAVQHGVSLGLGLVGMATKNAEVYEQLKNTLFSNADSAIIGEAAAYGMGLVMIGAADSESIQEILGHIEDQSHEKIIRALSMALAFQMYGKEEQADVLIEQMTRSKEAIVRYGAMYAIGTAYAGTANIEPVRKLLNFAVSDVNDDVKRAALTNLGFLFIKKPQALPDTVKHLAESYNPHLRYGAAMAVGVGCAGTGLNEALKLLAPLTNDQEDFVRQGALIALSMVFIQVTEAQEPKVATIKKLYTKLIEDKHEDILSRMGAILSQGIINAGGRNCTICLTTRDGALRQNAIIGMMLFMQHWYWYPMQNFLALALTPTALIGLNKNLKVPKTFKCVLNAKASRFKYPEFIKIDKDKKKERVAQAVLSTQSKAKARKDRREGKTGAAGGSELGSPAPTLKKNEDGDAEMKDDDKAAEKKEGEEEKEEEEPDQSELKNPSRMLKDQEQFISYSTEGARYIPVLTERHSGFIILREARDLGEGEGEDFYDDEERDADAPNPDLQGEFKLPEPFEFDPAIQNAPDTPVVQ